MVPLNAVLLKKKNRNKYLVFASTDKDKEVLARNTELWNKIKSLIEYSSIEKTDDKSGEYGKDYMRIKFISDDNLLLNKLSKLHMLTITVHIY